MTCTNVTSIGVSGEDEYIDIDIKVNITCKLSGKTRQNIRDALDEVAESAQGDCSGAIQEILYGIKRLI